MSHNHENADKVRQFIREYVRAGSDVIEEWLRGDGSVDAVGEELILLSLNSFRSNGTYNLSGLAGPYVEGLFRYAPGGHAAAIKTISSIIEVGEQVPLALLNIHLDLIRGIPLDSDRQSKVKKRGPKSRVGRRDALFYILLAVIKSQSEVSLYRNDAFSGDSDIPPYAMEIIAEELLPVMPDLEGISIKSLEDGVRRFMALEDTEGLNFAVPATPVCKILELMMAGQNPSPPKLPISFAVNKDTEEYLIVGAGEGNKLPQGFVLGDRVIKVGEQSVSTPTGLKTYLRGKTGKTDVVLKRGDKEVTASLSFSPQPKLLDRQYVLADGALITEDIYPERWGMEGFYQTHSVREGSYAARVGWVQYRLIMSIDGVRPTSLAHIKELLTGDENKVLIFRGWSAQDLLMHDYHEVEYWPYKVELKKAGE